MTAYRLATVLALRSHEVEVARADLARAVDALARRRSELAAHDAAVAAHAARAEDAARALAAAVGAGGDLASGARWAGRLRAELARRSALRGAAERAAAVAEAEAEARRATLATTRAGLSALERHREGWRAAAARRRDQRDQDASDDLVSARRAAR